MQSVQSQLRTRLVKEATAHGSLSISWKCASPVDLLKCVVDLDSRVVRYFFEVTKFAGKTAGARVMSWVSQLDPTTTEGVIIRPKWRKPNIETPLLVSQCTGVRELNPYLKSKGIDPSEGTLSRMQIEWHLTLEGRSGRQGREHLKQMLNGLEEFYARVISGLRSVETMPVQKIEVPRPNITTIDTNAAVDIDESISTPTMEC